IQRRNFVQRAPQASFVDGLRHEVRGAPTNRFHRRVEIIGSGNNNDLHARIFHSDAVEEIVTFSPGAVPADEYDPAGSVATQMERLLWAVCPHGVIADVGDERYQFAHSRAFRIEHTGY